MSYIARLSLLIILVIGTAGMTFAQGGATGAIVGTVEDASGAVVPGAQVKITNEAAHEVVRNLTSDPSGLFTAPLLPVGSYSVQVTAAGFGATMYSGVPVWVTETTRMTAVMQVAAHATEELEVSATVTKVETSPTTGQALGSVTITALPLATRNFQQLLTLSAGAASNLNSASQLGRGYVAMNVNGGRDDNNNYLIEGISASDYSFGELTYTPLPSPDAIQEFKVSTSLYDATQGRNGGGNINAILKSGTDHYHFDAWEYVRNTALDANDFFLNAASSPRPRIQQNIFGDDAGGPIGSKAQLGYFYLNYQGTRQRSGDSLGTYINTQIPVLPANRSVATLASLFSSPAVGECPAQTIGASQIDPVALALLNFKSTQFGGDANGYLIPSVRGTPGVSVNPNTCAPTLNTGSLVLSEVGKFTDDQFTSNWDRGFNSGKDHVSSRFFFSDSDTYEPFGADSLQIQTGGQPGANNLNFPLEVPLRGRFGSITETHIFANNLVNEFRFGVNVIGDLFSNLHPTGAGAVPTAAQVGINSANGAPDMYRFQFGSYAIGPYPTTTQSVLSDGFTYIDTLSWVHRAHTFRFGGEIDRNTLRRNLPILDNGLVYLQPGSNFALSDFQNFLMGSPLFAEAGGGAGNHDYHIPAFSLFAQDDYRVTQRLTLNLGIRNELLGAPYDSLCHIGDTDPGLASTGQPFVYPACVNQFNISGFKGTLNSASLDNEYASVWEPRIGLAYDLFGHHTTSLRVGYGMYSVREDLGAIDNLALSPPLFAVGVPFLPGPGSFPCLLYNNQSCSQGAMIPRLGQVSGNFLPTTSLLQGFPNNDTTQAPNISGNVPGFVGLYVPLHWIAPTTQQWNLTLQHEFGANWFLEVGYVGTKGTHLRVTYDPDEGNLVSPSHPLTVTAQNGQKFTITKNTAANAPARAMYLPLSPAAYEAFSPISDSHYNALQVTLSHRFGQGLYLQSAYTYSNSIDDVSTASAAFLTRFNDQNNASESTGLSDFNRRHRSITSFVYQLPFFKNRNDFAGKALGGWETSGVLTLQGGSPFTLMDSAGGTAVDLASPAITASFAPGYGCSNAPSTGSITSRLSHWVNPAAYQPAPVVGPDGSTGYGDSPRNCIVGPPQKNMDFTVGKTFRITERQSLRFRVDFFNFTNHPSFANPAAVDVESPSSFAQITQTIGTPRLVQFSLKYSY